MQYIHTYIQAALQTNSCFYYLLNCTIQIVLLFIYQMAQANGYHGYGVPMYPQGPPSGGPQGYPPGGPQGYAHGGPPGYPQQFPEKPLKRSGSINAKIYSADARWNFIYYLNIQPWIRDFVLNYWITHNPDVLISISNMGTFEFSADSAWSFDFGYPQFLCSLIGCTQKNSLASDWLFVFHRQNHS